MILVKTNRQEFAYDIHSLVKAFFQEEDVIVSAGEKNAGADPKIEISITFEENGIESRFRGCSGGDGGGPQAIPDGGDDGGPQEIMDSAADTKTVRRDRIELACADAEDRGSRKTRRNALKTLLYRQLRDVTGRALPWGNLTGIRPTKIPMDLLEEGASEAEAVRCMQEKYFVSPPKAVLATKIAARERRILQSIPYRQGYSLYIGIPFCPSICLYCSFSSSPLGLWKDRVDDYLDALETEMRSCSDVFAPRILQSIYIGGGTPTTLEPAQLDRLLCMTRRYFDCSRVREITVEAGRPDSITAEKLRVLKDHGIERISINPQTMNQETLDRIGRKHTVEEIREAFHMARRMGFTDINMDTIVGLPGEGPEEVRHTMEELAKLKPENITVHSLALKRGSRLAAMLEEYRGSSFTNTRGIMEMTQEVCENIGLYPYYLYRQKNMAGNFENVGYAAEGKEGLYNILIMEEKQSILALGAGSISKGVFASGRIERSDNCKDVETYLENIDEMIERKQKLFR